MYPMFTPFILLLGATLMLSTLMVVSSTNWILLWVALEINMLSFIPMILSSKTGQETEAAIKYFLSQALGSCLMLYASISMWLPTILPDTITSCMLTTSILLKLGCAPCHFWYPSVMTSASWPTCLILSTWQKLAPLAVLSFTLGPNNISFLTLVAGLSSIMGGMFGMAQTHLRTIMAYSSINHMGWMISLLSINKPVMSMAYYTMYCVIISPLFIIFAKMNLTMTSQKTTSYSSSYKPLTMCLLLLSLSGLPPLSGFLPKLMVLYALFSYNSILALVLIIGSLMSLFFYLSIFFTVLLNMMNTPSCASRQMPSATILTTSAIAALGLAPIMMI